MIVLEIHRGGEVISSHTLEEAEINDCDYYERIMSIQFPDGLIIQSGDTMRLAWHE